MLFSCILLPLAESRRCKFLIEFCHIHLCLLVLRFCLYPAEEIKESVILPAIHVVYSWILKLFTERKIAGNTFTPRVSYGDIKVVLTSESVDEILWCDHSNETSSAVLSHGTIYI